MPNSRALGDKIPPTHFGSQLEHDILEAAQLFLHFGNPDQVVRTCRVQSEARDFRQGGIDLF